MRRLFYCFVLQLLFSLTVFLSNASFASSLFIEADLQRHFPEHEQVQLGQDPTFLALKRPYQTGFQKGTVVLVPDLYEHAASAKYINFLRLSLPELGWNTLSIMPPVINLFDPVSVDLYQKQVKQRTQSAINEAQQAPGAVLIIAQGTSAAIINQLYANQQLTEVSALIILGAYLPDVTLNNQQAQAIASHAIPTLDITSSLDNHFALSQLKQRQQLVDKLFKAIYRQRLITGSGYETDNQYWVLQEIYGWLTSIGL